MNALVAKPVCILVLGTHRSGTSAATRVLNLLGAKLPEKTIGPAASNLKGHWEPASLVAVHEELLHAGGSSWDDLARFDLQALSESVQAGFRARILRILETEYGRTSDFIIKDPRICRFLPFWLDLLKEFGAEPKIVIPLRNPMEVAGSLAKRDRMDRGYAQYLWLRYALDAEYNSREVPRAFFSFSELLEDWKTTVTKLGSAIQLPFQFTDAAEKEIDEFLSADLRHQRSADDDLRRQGGTQKLVAEAFLLLKELTKNGDVTARARLDEIRSAFDKDASTRLAASRTELEQRRQHLEELTRDHHLKSVAVDELRVAVTTQTARAETLLHQVYEINQHVSQLGAEIGRLNTEMHYRNLEITRLSDALQQSYKDADDRVARRDREAQERIKESERKIAIKQGEFERKLAVHQGELQALKGSLSWRLTSPIRAAGMRFPRLARAGSAFGRVVYWTITLRLHSRLKSRGKRLQDLALLRDTTLFDEAFYRASKPGLPPNVDAALHYLQFGAVDDQNPSREFDGTAYLRTNPDVAASGENPLLHFLRSGVAEGREVAWPIETELNERLRASFRKSEFDLVGSDELTMEAGELVAIGSDSHVRLRPKEPLKRGWYRIDLVLYPPGLSPKAYFDLGEGYSEASGAKLGSVAVGQFSTNVYLPRQCHEFRIDPSDHAGPIDLRHVGVSRMDALQVARFFWGHAFRLVKRRESLVAAAGALWSRLRSKAVVSVAPSSTRQGYPAGTDYQRWINLFDYNSGRDRLRYESIVQGLLVKPLISVLMPTYNTPQEWLKTAIESVTKQIYPNWELCIADDCSTTPELREILEAYAAEDSRIKVIFRSENGHIAQATNAAFSLATGEWITCLDHDDVLREHALAEVAVATISNPNAQIIYSDEDKISNLANERFEPYFKPEFSPDLLRSQNYFNHLTVHRASNIRHVGAWRAGFEGSQDYDLNLRIMETVDAKDVLHIPKVLYHWRAVQGSTALDSETKDYAFRAALRAVEEHLERTGKNGKVQPVRKDAPFCRIVYDLPIPEPLVSLIIPTKDKADILRACLNSIFQRTAYGNYEILVVDNNSSEAATKAFFQELRDEKRVRVVPYPHPFNYSALNNFAVEQARGSIVGLVNNDIEVINKEWLSEMVSHAVRPEIGCVGAKLYYPNNTIQHAGVIIGLGGVAGHSHKYFPRDHPGYFWRLHLCQNLSAVTAACLLVRKNVYQDVGGLEEQALKVAFNDVDFCLKVTAAGYLNLWTPFAELYHHESLSRGTENTTKKRVRFLEEIKYMKSKWGKRLAADPYYSPNLTLDREDFGIRTN